MAIKYAKSEGASLGYRVTGEGPHSIIFVPGAYSNLAFERYFPVCTRWDQFLSKFGQLITFDKRGTGVSDQSVRPINLDQQVVDVEAIRNATNTENLIICGLSQGAPLSILYGLAYPERIKAQILIEGVCCDARNPFLPLSDANTLFDWERSLDSADRDFSEWCLERQKLINPDSSEEAWEAGVEYLQATASPASHRFIWSSLMGFDIRPMLRHAKYPTLVIHTVGDKLYPVEHGRYLAENIPGAEYLELQSNTHVPNLAEDTVPQLYSAIENFISALPLNNLKETSTRIVSTILFSDIVDSTKQQRTLGDSTWADKNISLEATANKIVSHAQGRVVKYLGDGVMAAFDVPGNSLKAAKALVDDAEKTGHPIRVGIHTGEVHTSGQDLSGVAVTIASRVAGLANAGEILTTRVTQGIVEGGDFSFEDWGDADLKGVGKRSLVRLVR